MSHTCEACGTAATHTAFNERNTMTWLCDSHAEDLIDEIETGMYDATGLILVPTVEETHTERRERLAAANLLQEDE